MIPVWSPDVCFLFDPALSATDIIARLRALGVGAVLVPARNRGWLDLFKFFREDLEPLPCLAQRHGTLLYKLP